VASGLARKAKSGGAARRRAADNPVNKWSIKAEEVFFDKVAATSILA
jgi:hypothetical protein